MSLEPILKKVQKNLNEGNVKIALLDLKSAEGMAPDDWRVAYYYGRCYLETGEIDKAIEHFKKAHSVQPLPEISYFLAMSYVKNKSWDDAASVADTALQNDMDDLTTKAALYYIKSGASMEKNKLDDAIAAAEKAVELVPNDEQYKTHLEPLKNAKG
ncbi:tetratricopeptide repeat protein [Candidatus Thorarchaeota archaeon]|nr:MAG: tetratricopeptide repeat protein [Candidatus Thorarchaeota archaeon]